jgi:hypothetical protein
MWLSSSIISVANIFLYVGPDEDAFSLNLLRPSETQVVFIEPLVAWRNRFRKNEAKDRGNFDRLHECEKVIEHIDPRFTVCALPLTRQDVGEYVATFRRNLIAASRCNAPENNGLKDLRILSLNASLDRLSMAFVSAGISRSLHILFRRVQDVDWTAFEGRAISTLAFLGVAPNAAAAVELFCSNRVRAGRLRVVANDGMFPWMNRVAKTRNPQCCVPDSTCKFRMSISNPLLGSYTWKVDPLQLCNQRLRTRNQRQSRS